MFRLFHRGSRVFVCAAIAFAAAGPARGVQVSLPPVPVQILGADSLCTSWTPGGTAGAPTLTCVTGGGGGAPFFCTLSGAPTGAIAPGTAVNLQMFCVGGSAPYTYLWTPGNSTASSLSANPTAPTTFSVTARDGAGGISTKSADVSVSSGGGGGALNCATAQGLGIQSTGSTVPITMDWNTSGLHTISLGVNDTGVISFTPTSNSNGIYVKVSGTESGSVASTRYATLSTQACDFRTSGTGLLGASYASSYQFYFSVGPNNSFGYYPALTVGQPYFINIQTVPGNCSNSCNMFLELNKNGAP